jgi:hypothetical protein
MRCGERRMELPEWWNWELAYTEHVESRMDERGVSDVDLRTMLQSPISVQPGRPGRWQVEARHAEQRWTVVLEPDFDDRVVFVVTVYQRDDR